MQTVKGFLSRLTRDTAGNILPLAAVGVVVAAAIVGSAIDMSQAYRVDNRLQAACDAAVLAGRHAVTTNGFDNTAKTAAENFFATNYSDDVEHTTGTAFVPTSDDNGVTVKGVATTTYSTLVMRLFGYNTIPLSASCTSSMGVGNSDVVLVLDNTGSMDYDLTDGQTRLQALQAAMKNFYTTLSTATSGSNARIRYGFVPYSTTVNVGHLLYDQNPDMIADKHTYSSRKAVYKTVVTDDPTYSNEQTGSSWVDYSGGSGWYWQQSSCEADLPAAGGAYADYGSSSTSDSSTSTNSSGQTVTVETVTQQQRQTAAAQCVSRTGYYYGGSYTYYIIQVKYNTRDKTAVTTTTYGYEAGAGSVFDHFDYMPVEYDTSTYKTFASVTTPTGDAWSGASQPGMVTSTWNGCIHERKTAAESASNFSYSSLFGVSPSDALDIDIDTAPDVNDDDTKWAPMWPQIVYQRSVRTGTDYWGNPTYTETTGIGDSGRRASSPCPVRAQGLKSMSKDAFDDYADSLNATGNTYLDIGMIWGGRLLSPNGIFSSTVNEAPSNGGKVSRHIVFMTDGVMQPNNSINEAWGLEWWDRKVTDDGSSNDTARHTARFLTACSAIKSKGIRIWVIAFTSGLSNDLKTCASDDSSFTASDAGELNKAFQEIAKQVGELRVTS
ncbi:Tad domain-containing protein [Novosphingobium beihaiensis]|uniref:Pilus assembly protein TadG-related protein n=1 Tax=Novosphingobium beihaiensis TaxID=2930389 RepID=A0ABT0BM68_9SPHN|nr:Tad domain-containing protein [Novosphingobium beihaiensis]MCJ2185926.1 pilus assembly protein TadG-related protein [Novosphingobium beihaiensis]